MTNTHNLPVHLHLSLIKKSTDLIRRILNDKKLMVRSKYEKYEILLARPHVEGTNELSITHDSVKNTGPSILWKK